MGKPHTFESLKARTEEVGDCWEWTGHIHKWNAPQVKVGKSSVSVRGLLMRFQGKPVVKGYFLAPRCGNPKCVNPDHVVMRKPSDHYRHIGKRTSSSPAHAARVAHAVRKTCGKLDMDKAREIRLSLDPANTLAQKYGVHRSVINRIRRNEAWRDFSNPFAGLIG